jgi:hypothetical protein
MANKTPSYGMSETKYPKFYICEDGVWKQVPYETYWRAQELEYSVKCIWRKEDDNEPTGS